VGVVGQELSGKHSRGWPEPSGKRDSGVKAGVQPQRETPEEDGGRGGIVKGVQGTLKRSSVVGKKRKAREALEREEETKEKKHERPHPDLKVLTSKTIAGGGLWLNGEDRYGSTSM